MTTNETYEVTNLNKVKRSAARANYDHDVVHSIFRAAPVVHVGYVTDEGLPACIPTIGSIHESDEGIFVYLHGHGKAGFVDAGMEYGARLVVTATLVDGYVLSLTPFHHSMNYRSAVLHGFSDPFPDPSTPEGKKSKYEALTVVTDSVIAGRWDVTRPPTDAEVTSTGLVRMRIESGSAKKREGGPKDDKKDYEDAALTSKTWSGVIPLRYVAGEPIPADCTKEKDFPNGPTPEVVALLKTFK